MLETNTHRKDIVAPVKHQKYIWISHDASTHHFMMFSLSTLNINGMLMVDTVYCSTHLIFTVILVSDNLLFSEEYHICLDIFPNAGSGEYELRNWVMEYSVPIFVLQFSIGVLNQCE